MRTNRVTEVWLSDDHAAASRRRKDSHARGTPSRAGNRSRRYRRNKTHRGGRHAVRPPRKHESNVPVRSRQRRRRAPITAATPSSANAPGVGITHCVVWFAMSLKVQPVKLKLVIQL